MSDIIKSQFLEVYFVLKSELRHDPSFNFTHDSHQWLHSMLDNNVPGGKLNKGLSVVDSYKLLKDGKEIADDKNFLATLIHIGVIAVNDGLILRNHIQRILKNHFREEPYYVDLLDLFNEGIFTDYESKSYDKLKNPLILTHVK